MVGKKEERRGKGEVVPGPGSVVKRVVFWPIVGGCRGGVKSFSFRFAAIPKIVETDLREFGEQLCT